MMTTCGVTSLAPSQQSELLRMKEIKCSEKPAIIIHLTPQSQSILPPGHNSRKDARQGKLDIIARKTARLKWSVQPPLIIWRLGRFIFNYNTGCVWLEYEVNTFLPGVWTEWQSVAGLRSVVMILNIFMTKLSTSLRSHKLQLLMFKEKHESTYLMLWAESLPACQCVGVRSD